MGLANLPGEQSLRSDSTASLPYNFVSVAVRFLSQLSFFTDLSCFSPVILVTLTIRVSSLLWGSVLVRGEKEPLLK